MVQELETETVWALLAAATLNREQTVAIWELVKAAGQARSIAAAKEQETTVVAAAQMEHTEGCSKGTECFCCP